MKFFSNEKETEVEPQADPDRTQPVSSGPVTVPPQRAGSPWSDAPAPADGSRPADGPDDTAVVDRQDGTTEKTVTSTTYGPDGSVVEDESYRATHTDAPRDDSPVDLPLTDSDDARADAGSRADATTDVTKSPEQEAIKDDGTFDSPKAVDPATGKKLDDTDRADTSDRLDSEDFQRASDTPPASPVAEAAAVPVAAVPASKPATSANSGDKLLPDGDSFAERFRDIQLRFVDEPKEATAEAATLVGDAVDKLTSALKAQRDGLAGNSDDTEKLRVELRAYREILNRLLAL